MKKIFKICLALLVAFNLIVPSAVNAEEVKKCYAIVSIGNGNSVNQEITLNNNLDVDKKDQIFIGQKLKVLKFTIIIDINGKSELSDVVFYDKNYVIKSGYQEVKGEFIDWKTKSYATITIGITPSSERGIKEYYGGDFPPDVERYSDKWENIAPRHDFTSYEGVKLKGTMTYTNCEDMSVGTHDVGWTFTPDDMLYPIKTGVYHVTIIESPAVTVVEEDTTVSLTADTILLETSTEYDININNKPEVATYEWTTSDEDIVVVNSINGKIKAVDEGEAIVSCEITYQDETTDTLTSEITVGYDDNAAALTDATVEIEIGDKYDIDNENTIAKSKIRWTSSDKTVATVNSKGLVTGISDGTAYITCTITTPTNQVIVLRCDLTVTK